MDRSAHLGERGLRRDRTPFRALLCLGVVLAWTLPPPELLQADWVILRDGRVGRVVAGGEVDVKIKVSDGEPFRVPMSQIAEQLTDKARDTEVDRLVRAIGRNTARERNLARLTRLGAAAAPRLLHHLKSSQTATRIMAVSCLQLCWLPEAAEPVAAAMADRDATVRKLAASALQRNAGTEKIAKLLGGLANHADPNIAGPAIRTVEHRSPDLDRMVAAMGRRELWRYVAVALGRYRSGRLTGPTRRMLTGSTMDDKIRAVCALTWQQDNSPQTRARITGMLQGGQARLREAAAEYLRWHGTEKERPATEAAAQRERDPFCRAALTAAVEAIDLRKARFAAAGEVPDIQWPDEPVMAYTAALVLLRKYPNQGTREKVLGLLRRVEAFEPVCDYERHARKSGNPGGVRSGSAKAAPARTVPRSPRAEVLFELLAFVFGYPEVCRPSAPAAGNGSRTKPAMPVVGKLVPPVRGYYDPSRKSFGHYTSPTLSGVFGGSYHVGDDVAWHRPRATVVAAGDGVVRLAAAGQYSWGSLVLIEHGRAGGMLFCSLYAHLGPLLCVREGDVVRAGQKLGVIGQDYTWANGGYLSHLHFAVHTGSYRSGPGAGGPTGWLTGYLSPERFKSGRHGWIDPQAFIRKRWGTGTSQGPTTSPAGGGDVATRLRLAKTYISAGLTSKAREILKDIRIRHQGTDEARQAVELLKSLRP